MTFTGNKNSNIGSAAGKFSGPFKVSEMELHIMAHKAANRTTDPIDCPLAKLRKLLEL